MKDRGKSGSRNPKGKGRATRAPALPDQSTTAASTSVVSRQYEFDESMIASSTRSAITQG